MAIANVVADPGGVVNIEVDPQVAGGSLAGFGEPAHCPLTARIPTPTPAAYMTCSMAEDPSRQAWGEGVRGPTIGKRQQLVGRRDSDPRCAKPMGNAGRTLARIEKHVRFSTPRHPRRSTPSRRLRNWLLEVPRTSRTGDPLGSFSEKVRARASRSTEVLPRVQG